MRDRPKNSNGIGWQDHVAAIANGVLGDWLDQRGNPLAIDLQVLHNGNPLNPHQPAPVSPERTLIVLTHGLTELESIWDYPGHPGIHYGTGLAHLMAATPLCLRYNSGRPIYRNGQELAATMETLVENWPVPVERILFLGHSMGGLLVRSACHQGSAVGHQWINQVDSCVYLGSPHDGSWLARAAHGTAGMLQKMPRDYLKVMGDVIDVRSEGIRNLTRGEVLPERRMRAPLLPTANHYAISGLLANNPRHPINTLFGDALVHEDSARGAGQPGWELTDYAAFPGINHIRLTHNPAVYRQLREWLA